MTHGSLCVIGLAALFLAPSVGSAAVRRLDPEPLSVTTPEATTAKWENARELLTLLESSDDRAALALSVRDECIDGGDLTDAQIADGLYITGHVLYRENHYADSRTAFEHLLQHDTSDHYFVEANRILAQLARLDGDHASSLALYQAALPVAQQQAAQQSSGGLILILSGMMDTLDALNRFDEAADTADSLLLAMGDKPAPLPRASLLLNAARLHKKAENLDRASSLYADLLADPAFGSAPMDWGLRPTVVMEQLECDGHSLSSCDPVAMQRAMQLFADEGNAGMPSIYGLIDQLTACLLRKGDGEPAMQLWIVGVKSIDDAIPNLPADKQWAVRPLRAFQATMMWNSYTMAVSRNLDIPPYAADFLDRIQADFADVVPALAQRAADYHTGMFP